MVFVGVIWPNNSKVSVCLTWDVDGESATYFRMPEYAKKHLSELHQRRYGPTVGIKKIRDLLDRSNIKGTFYIPGYIAGLYKEVVKNLNEAGHSIGLHGYLHESLDNLTYTEEEEILLKSKEIINNLIDYEPNIYRSPSWELNRWTPELLLKNGVLCDSSLMDDESPYLLETESGSPLLEVPIQWILDDAEYWMHTRFNREKAITDPDTVLKIWKREFDGYYKNRGCFVLTLHPFMSGRWVYMDAVEKLIDYIKQFEGVWWTTVEEVTTYCLREENVSKLETKKSPPPTPFII
jgi:peptidoglycan-N-acetylglucosamine deacetylase